ncbi:MAG TPA: hypothetical protein VJZ70_06210 [Limnochordia bacterium]|jgi:hypothetical protein|nr:hypothetical protein [Limnochordia bacterium]
MRKIVLFSLVTLLVLSIAGQAHANFTMSWQFGLINNPNARQVALNIANAQQELLRTTDDQSGLDRFKESLDRMAMSKAVRDIVNFDPEAGDEGYGFVPVDDGWIYYEWDDEGEIMRIFHYADGSWTEITIDSGAMPSRPTW